MEAVWRHRCESLVLQIDVITFNYVDHAPHTNHRRECGRCGALGEPHGLRSASTAAIVTLIQSIDHTAIGANLGRSLTASHLW
eukprot:7168681-Prymnesium_polylepis.1